MAAALLRSRRGFLAAAGAVAFSALPACHRAPPLNGVDITGARYASGFSLRDADGRTRTLSDFRGRAVLVFFGFTQCPDVCPTALARAAETKRLLGPDGERLQVIFVTIDPERDTPPVLASYAQAFDPSFLGLYGTPEKTAAVAREFKVYYNKVPTGSSYTMDHSAFSYVFDPAGRVRLVLPHNQSAQQYADDLRTILAAS